MKFKKTMVTSIAAALLASGVMADKTKADSKVFYDVDESAWYYTSVQKLTQQNIITGYSDQTFRPSNNITRSQAAAILARALELNASNVTNPKFKDVPTTHSNYGAIAALTELGVFKKNEKFNPNGLLTRAQMAQILVVAFELKGDYLKDFSDVKSTDWSYKYIGTLGSLGITTNEGKFNPNGTISRAQIAAFIERIIDYKRTDDTYDLWDEWSEWDDVAESFEDYYDDEEYSYDDDYEWNADYDDYEPEIIDPKEPSTPNTQLTEPELASYVFDLEKSVKDLDKAIIRIKAEIKDYKAIERDKEASKNEVEDILEDVESAQRNLKTLIEHANLLIKDVEKVSATTNIVNAQRELERILLTANAELTSSYDTVVDIEGLHDDLEDILDDLLDEIVNAEKTLVKENADVEDLEEAYDDLSKEVKTAKKILDDSNTGKVAVVRGLKKDLETAIKDAEDVMKDLLDRVGDLETDFEYETDQIIKRLRVLTDSFNEAVRKQDSADIKYYEQKVLEKLKEAEDLVDDMEDTKLNKVKPYITDLEDEIEDIERFLEKAEKRID